MRSSTSDVGVPVELNITFRLTRDLVENEVILIDLPRFTRTVVYTRAAREAGTPSDSFNGLQGGDGTKYGMSNDVQVGLLGRVTQGENVTMGELQLAPSNDWFGAWVEGENILGTPYYGSQLQLTARFPPKPLVKGHLVEVTVLASNNINAFCGGPSYIEYYDPLRLHQAVPVPSIHSRVLAGNSSYNYNTFSSTATFQKFPAFYNGRNPLLDVTSTSNWTVRTPLDAHSSSIITTHAGCSEYNDCSGHGYCDYCYQKCICVDGWGGASDVVNTGSDLDLTCSRRVCPTGITIAGLSATKASDSNPTLDLTKDVHSTRSECSNVGLCDRKTGECKCFPPFTGAACDKLACPTKGGKECSGHGTCFTMADLARQAPMIKPDVWLNSPTQVTLQYGSAEGMVNKTTWDSEVMRGCKCDSSWSVGYETGQRQLSEWFGADCSLKRCPGGDDPSTSLNEEDCEGKNVFEPRSSFVGKRGNRCHVDCSNRGVCNYNTGQCKCFPGYFGDNCGSVARTGRSERWHTDGKEHTLHGN